MAVRWLQTELDSLAFLPRDAMLARYMLSSCVRLSVCHKPVLYYRNNWTNRAGLAQRLPFFYRRLCYKEIWVSPYFKVLPSGTLSQTPNLENFATASRSRCQQHSSSSSTVELVDDTYKTIDGELWLFTTSRPTVTL